MKVLPAKNPQKKLKESNQDEMVNLLSEIVSNQKTLVNHHTAESDLSKALSLFKTSHSADLTAMQRLKFQKYLKENCSIFLLQDEEEREASIQDCLDV